MDGPVPVSVFLDEGLEGPQLALVPVSNAQVPGEKVGQDLLLQRTEFDGVVVAVDLATCSNMFVQVIMNALVNLSPMLRMSFSKDQSLLRPNV